MSNQHPELEARIAELVREAWGDRRQVCAISPLAGDASSRSYLRITLDAPSPATAVVMIQPDSGLSISSDELAVFEEPLQEMPFRNVQRYLRSSGVAVPEIFAVDRDLVLLEDVGDTTLWDAAGERSEEGRIRLYRAAIDEMIRLQRAGETHPDPRCIAFRQRFDARLFLWEFEHFLEYGFTGRAVASATRVDLRRRFEDLAEELAGEPVVLTHRDYHSWNLFVQEERIRVIDFQDALLAPVPYDLATLLNDRATPRRITPAMERALIGHFVNCRGDDTDRFFPVYDRFVLQKSLKIVGRFHYLESVKGRSGYVAMLPDTFATLRRCFDRSPGLASLRSLLVASFPELA